MDLKNSNAKWIVSAATLVAAFIGVYYLYKKWNFHHGLSIANFPHEKPEIKKSNTQREEALKFKKQGNEHFSNGDFENAIKAYNSAIEICPKNFSQDNAILFQNKAISLHRLKLFDEALVEVNRALEFSPQYNTALVTRSKIFESKGKYQEALLDITAAVTFDTTNKPDSIEIMDNILKTIAIEIAKNELMNEPILRSEFDIKIYLESFTNDPFITMVNSDTVESGNKHNESVSHCFNLFRTGNYSDSFHAVVGTLKSTKDLNNGTLSQLHLLRGTFYLLSCREDLALDDFIHVIDNPESKPLEKINAIIKWATIKLTDEVPSHRKDMFNEAVHINPDCADIYYHRGLCYENVDEWQRAINDYQTVINIDPGHILATAHIIYSKYFLVQANADLVDTCFNEFKNLMQKYPNCIQIEILFAKILINAGYYEEADKISEEMLRLQPNSGSVMAFVADIKFYRENIAESITILNKAILIDPKHAECYYSLAKIYIKNGELENAIGLLEKAIKYAKDRQLMQEYIGIREGISAQLNVSKRFDIPIKDVMHHMSQGEIL